mmetsp:Transcript_26565/g.61841  ORF Transcript_26565/g.61841 Transcript_26565/m.61841 type:complete len:201 (+) Transcript_26565:299-901(+)
MDTELRVQVFEPQQRRPTARSAEHQESPHVLRFQILLQKPPKPSDARTVILIAAGKDRVLTQVGYIKAGSGPRDQVVELIGIEHLQPSNRNHLLKPTQKRRGVPLKLDVCPVICHQMQIARQVLSGHSGVAATRNEINVLVHSFLCNGDAEGNAEGFDICTLLDLQHVLMELFVQRGHIIHLVDTSEEAIEEDPAELGLE